MKLLILSLVISLPSIGAVTKKSFRANEHLSYEQYSVPKGACEVIGEIQNHQNKEFSLRVVSVKKGEEIGKGGSPCPITQENYSEAVTEILKEYKGPRPTEFTTGYVRNPLDHSWQVKLAISSARDEGFKQISKEGEISTTFNQVFSRIVNEQKVFASFIGIHKKLGLDLEYVRVEKVFREKVENAYNKDALLKAGLKASERYFSGAAIIFFKVK